MTEHEQAANHSTFAPLVGPVPTLVLADGAIRIERGNEQSKPDELWHGPAVHPETGEQFILYVRIGEPRALMAELLFATIAHALHLPAARPFLVKVPSTAVAGSRLHAGGTQTVYGCQDARSKSFAVMLNETSNNKALLRKWDKLGEVAALDEWLINGDRNFGNLIYSNGAFTLIDHAEAFANQHANLWGLEDLIATDFVANKLAQFATEELSKSKVNAMWANTQKWLHDNAAALDVKDCIDRSQIEYVRSPHTHQELVRFIEGRLTFTGSLLCQKLLGQASLSLQTSPAAT